MSPESVFTMSLREIDLQRRAFLFREARDWDRTRFLIANIFAVVGGKVTPQQILPIPLLDGGTEVIAQPEVTEEDIEWFKKMEEKWRNKGA